MKNQLLCSLFLFAFATSCFAQRNVIGQYAQKLNDIDFVGKVKRIKLTQQVVRAKNKDSKPDTTATYFIAHFEKTGKISKQQSFFKNFDNKTQDVLFDSQERIVLIDRIQDGRNFKIRQFFSNPGIFPDSLNMYWNGDKKTSQYVNHFKNGLPIKQEFFQADTLRSYNLFTYDKKKRLAKDVWVNTKYGAGITLALSGPEEKELYPNDSTTYGYLQKKDTLIRIESTASSMKISKTFKGKGFSGEIIESWRDGKLYKQEVFHTYKDSTFRSCRNYVGGELFNSSETHTAPERILYRFRSDSNTSNDTVFETKIVASLDERKNWIRKTFTENGKTTKILIREIEYHD